MSRVGETGVGEMGIGETGVGEMGVGETGPNHFNRGSDGGEISPLNARVKRTWTHSHQTFQQRRKVNQGGHSSPRKSVERNYFCTLLC